MSRSGQHSEDSQLVDPLRHCAPNSAVSGFFIFCCMFSLVPSALLAFRLRWRLCSMLYLVLCVSIVSSHWAAVSVLRDHVSHARHSCILPLTTVRFYSCNSCMFSLFFYFYLLHSCTAQLCYTHTHSRQAHRKNYCTACVCVICKWTYICMYSKRLQTETTVYSLLWGQALLYLQWMR